jgi:hypothetical protein
MDYRPVNLKTFQKFLNIKNYLMHRMIQSAERIIVAHRSQQNGFVIIFRRNRLSGVFVENDCAAVCRRFRYLKHYFLV